MKREVNFDLVIKDLRAKYEWALKQEYIRVPIAWALYETWKDYDRRK